MKSGLPETTARSLLEGLEKRDFSHWKEYKASIYGMDFGLDLGRGFVMHAEVENIRNDLMSCSLCRNGTDWSLASCLQPYTLEDGWIAFTGKSADQRIYLGTGFETCGLFKTEPSVPEAVPYHCGGRECLINAVLPTGEYGGSTEPETPTGAEASEGMCKAVMFQDFSELEKVYRTGPLELVFEVPDGAELFAGEG